MRVDLNSILFACVITLIGFNLFLFILLRPKKEMLIPGVNLPEPIEVNLSYPKTNKTRTCKTSSDCTWISTNCCPPNAGAYWECLNRNSYIDCKSKMVLCPQILSPMPRASCECINGSCVA